MLHWQQCQPPASAPVNENRLRADLKNMNEANYKDTRITLAEAASAIFVVDFEHVLVCWDILRSNKLQNPKK